MKIKIKKTIAILILIITLFSVCSNLSYATEITSANLQNSGDCGQHLQFMYNGQWSYIKTTYVTYTENGVQYPAYCLNKELPGVETAGDYGVNIDSVMDDVRIWRAVINGYPYQTPAAMGVENELDAFVATKQAIYSILYGNEPESYYNGADSRGVAIKNAIINLVNIGRYGTQTPNNTDVNVNKVGGFYEDGDYYSQNYRVDSPVETSLYNIIATNGLPANSKITDLSNNEKTTFSGNETFKVKIPKSELSKDINVTIVVRAKCKTYPVFYGESTVPGTQNYLVTYDPFGDVAGRTNFNLATNTGKIEIHKTDAETSKAIQGVVFGLYKKDGTELARATTNEQGIAVFNSLYQNSYTLKEISTNENYVLNKTDFNADVLYNKTTKLDIENEHKRGNLKVYKVDKDNHKVTLGNVSFDLYSEEFKKVLGTYATNVDGEIFIDNLRTGNYSLIEKNTGKWYNLADDTNVKVEWNETTNVTIENELQKGRIKVIKVDKENNEVKLKGVVFQILDENKNVIETITTNEDGEALTSRYPIRDYQKLYILEVETNEFYKLNDEQVEVVLQANQITTMKFENEKKKGQIQVIKVDKDNNEVKLKDVTFEVYDENNNFIETLVTDENGTATTDKLPIDKNYIVKETITNESYVLSDETKTVTLQEDQITSITFENEKKKGQIKVIKVDGENNEVKLEGVTFEILDKDKNVVDEIKTDLNGEATSERLAIDNEYTVKEKETLKEYKLSDEETTVTLEENEIKELKFENYKIKGQIKVKKIDSKTNELLAGAKFAVENSKGEIVGTYLTNEDGIFETDLLEYGEYKVYEIECPEGYLLDAEPKTTSITEDGKVMELEFTNAPVEKELPKTGVDDNVLQIALGIILLGILVVIAVIIKIIKDKKEEE